MEFEESLITTDPVPRSARNSLSLLSFNIQTGVDTKDFHEYVTKSWKHLLPLKERISNLNRIADLVQTYDVVGLQEVDSGSLRTGFLDQTEYLAHRARFPYWYRQVNRSLGKIAQHSNGVLSRIRPHTIDEHKLPGLRGRGAMLVELPTNREPLLVCIMHLALGKRARRLQLAYISELVKEYSQLVVMGDFNCGTDSRELHELVDSTHLKLPVEDLKTFPSWKPNRKFDHILISESLSLQNTHVLEHTHSDHLPICVEIKLPKGVVLEQ
ncbi:MAG: endonuclease/exonuclease/phosphatase family protein [Xanthomonadales bacterium]|nr:endonuclease/exonuclease/phosphatase family protein [Xanthomonadales bacterium]MDH4020254.1 endonuclease/exonuclease/phosphatase family protein [Xanthomonadales bacterium]